MDFLSKPGSMRGVKRNFCIFFLGGISNQKVGVSISDMGYLKSFGVCCKKANLLHTCLFTQWFYGLHFAAKNNM